MEEACRAAASDSPAGDASCRSCAGASAASTAAPATPLGGESPSARSPTVYGASLEEEPVYEEAEERCFDEREAAVASRCAVSPRRAPVARASGFSPATARAPPAAAAAAASSCARPCDAGSASEAAASRTAGADERLGEERLGVEQAPASASTLASPSSRSSTGQRSRISRWPGLPSLRRISEPTASREAGEPLPRPVSFTSRTSKRLGAIIPRVTVPALPDITDDKDRMSFMAFTVLLGCLWCFTVGTNAMLLLTVSQSEDSRADFRPTIAFPHFVWFCQIVWLCFQGIIFLDVASSYLLWAWCHLCPSCSACCVRRCAPGLSRPTEARDYIGSSDLRRPHLWRMLDGRLGVELTPRRYLLVLSLLLPVNVLVFYRNIGAPVYTRSRLSALPSIDALTESPWPSTGSVHMEGLSLDLLTWIITSQDARLDPPVTINSKECYHPEDPEFKLLTRLHDLEAAKQAHCESVLGKMLVFRMGWDDDMWEELYSFTVRLFGAFAGVIADHMLSTEGSGFLEDMTDIFDMYLLSFADVAQMHEGRPLLGSKSDLPTSFHDFVPFFLVSAYSAMILRALAMFGYMPIARLLIRLGHPAGQAGGAGLKRLQVSVGAATSLAFIEVPFLSLRAMALMRYQVPVSVLAVKNVLHAYRELRILRVFKGFGEESEHDHRKEVATNLCWSCRKRRAPSQELEEQRASIVAGAELPESGSPAASAALEPAPSAGEAPEAAAAAAEPAAASSARRRERGDGAAVSRSQGIML